MRHLGALHRIEAGFAARMGGVIELRQTEHAIEYPLSESEFDPRFLETLA